MADPILYILMRNDLASLNPGKACAQATHAANQCIFDARSEVPELLSAWEEGRGFGTCIVLAAPMGRIEEQIKALAEKGVHCGITHDPGYPLRDGDVTHSIPLNTCGFAFGERDQIAPILSSFELMP